MKLERSCKLYIGSQFVCKFLVDEGVLFYNEKFCPVRQNDPTVP